MNEHCLRFAATIGLLLLASHTIAAPISVIDDTGRNISLAGPAERIVSLAPHITELLYAAGAGNRVVGAVAYSDYPAAASTLPRVGGYSAIDMEAVAALRPDLVIAWKSGNRDAHLERFAALGIPVFRTNLAPWTTWRARSSGSAPSPAPERQPKWRPAASASGVTSSSPAMPGGPRCGCSTRSGTSR